MSARWLPVVALLGVVLLSAGALAGPHHCFGGEEGGEFSAQSVSSPPPAALMAAFLLIPILGAALAVAGGLARRPKKAAIPAVEGEWIATDTEWVFVPRAK